MNCRTTLSLSVAILLTGCHSYAPRPVDLDRHVATFAERYRALQAQNGLHRRDAREAAKVLHPEARLSRKRAGVATAQRDNAGRWVDPQLGLQLQKILESVPYQWVAQAQIGFTLPINGRLDRQRNLAERQRDEAIVTAWQTEQQVANELDRAWVRFTTTALRVDLLDELIGSLQRLETLALALVDAGNLTKPGARVFTLERSQREADLFLAQAEHLAATLAVKQRLGVHPDAPLELLADLDVAPFVANGEERREGLLQSPRIVALRMQHQSSEANLELQIRRQWPDLVLQPIWQEEDAQPRPGIGLNVPLPLWTGNDPAIARARAERDVAATELQVGIEQLLQELAVAELQRDTAIAQRERLDQLLELAHEQVRDGKRLADAGQFDPLLQLDALVRVYDVQLQALTVREQQALATIDINDLLTDPNSMVPTTGEGASR